MSIIQLDFCSEILPHAFFLFHLSRLEFCLFDVLVLRQGGVSLDQLHQGKSLVGECCLALELEDSKQLSQFVPDLFRSVGHSQLIEEDVYKADALLNHELRALLPRLVSPHVCRE